MRHGLIQKLHAAVPPALDMLCEAPILLYFGKTTRGLNRWHLDEIAKAGGKFAAAVATNPSIMADIAEYMPVISAAELMANSTPYRECVLANYETSGSGYSYFPYLASRAGLPSCDKAALMAAWDLLVIFDDTGRTIRQAVIDHLDEYVEEVQQLYADEDSRQAALSMLLFRVTYDRAHLLPFMQGKVNKYFSPNRFIGGGFTLRDDEHFIDCGANVGWVLDKLVGATGNRFASITAVEPDPACHTSLVEKFGGLGNTRFVKAALSDSEGTRKFVSYASANNRIIEEESATFEGTVVTVDAKRLDDIADEATFIKMDVEGSELEAFRGGTGLIERCKPRIAVSAYHHPLDMMRIPQLLRSIRPDYSFFLKLHSDFYYGACIYAQ